MWNIQGAFWISDARVSKFDPGNKQRADSMGAIPSVYDG